MEFRTDSAGAGNLRNASTVAHDEPGLFIAILRTGPCLPKMTACAHGLESHRYGQASASFEREKGLDAETTGSMKQDPSNRQKYITAVGRFSR